MIAFTVFYNPDDFSIHEETLTGFADTLPEAFFLQVYSDNCQKLRKRDYRVLVEVPVPANSEELKNQHLHWDFDIWHEMRLISVFSDFKKDIVRYFELKEKAVSEADEKTAEENKRRIDQTVEDWITQQEKQLAPVDNSGQKDVITGDGETLKRYLLNLINVESSIFSVRERLCDLSAQNEQANELDAENIRAIESKVKKYRSQKERELKKWYESEKANGPKRPVEPVKPVNKAETVMLPELPIAPEEPVLKQPKLFNRKAVEAENRELSLNYERMRNSYLAKMQEYQNALSRKQRAEEMEKEYERQMETYRTEKQQYTAELKQYEIEAANYTAKLDQQMEEKKVALLENIETMRKNEIDKLSENLQQAASNLIRSELSQARTLMSEMLKARSALYAYNGVFSKYHNLVALSSFYEYLLAGRCESLEGTAGAYNIYETEIRTNQIISQMSAVLNSLEQIKNTQYMVYEKLETANTELRSLNAKTKNMFTSLEKNTAEIRKGNKTLNAMDKTLSSVQGDVSIIRETNGIIAENSEVIAYNTAASAFYSKKNAELTDALGFMMALK